MSRSAARRRLLAPEVVQTSAMDCGPASLKCLLEGYGVHASYGRLREACQTDVDGTSIDTLEDIAAQLGLEAEQVMVPVDHLLLEESGSLPCLLVVRVPSGFTHFLVVWRRHGPLVQVMDPASGRRWMPCSSFLDDVYVHEQRLPAGVWHAWASSDGFLRPLDRRLRELGLGRGERRRQIDTARSDSWQDLARLDAATRLGSSLVRSGGVRRGGEAGSVLEALLERARTAPPGRETGVPEAFWSARCAEADPAGGDDVLLRGAVLLRVPGLSATPRAGPGADRTTRSTRMTAGETRPAKTAGDDDRSGEAPGTATPLSPELAAALDEAPARPLRELFRFLRGDGALSFAAIGLGLFISAGSVILEALILRSVIQVGRDLALVTQRLEAVGYFLVFAVALLLVELRVAGALLRLGRRVETRLRLAFYEKLPRLTDRYFESRPVSDMAERSHSIHKLRELPKLGGDLVRAGLGLVITAAAIAWIFPPGAWLALLAAALAVGLPLAFKTPLEEKDLRVRTHTGALGRFYLDALLGHTAVLAHGAAGSVRREHEGLLADWASAALRLVRTGVLLDALQALSGLGLAALLVFLYAGRSGEPAGALLLAYWSLHLPILGEKLALLARQYPIHHNLALRLLEPLGAPEEERRDPDGTDGKVSTEGTDARSEAAETTATGEAHGAAVSLESVHVVAAGHTILEDIDLDIAPGEHVAVVGASGAGKSSLAGLLLGWHRAAAGCVRVDGAPLAGRRLELLRRETAWIDPSVQLWNRSLLDNLTYGSNATAELPFHRVLEEADLHGVLERLPEGLQTRLGEGGGLVSGGEGQRVRLGRGMLRSGVRLVILDEPFRGLDREARHELLGRVRRLWRRATLIFISHDVAETRSFERVLVVDGGRIVEDGPPEALAADAGSRYRALLETEDDVRHGVWGDPVWRRLRLEGGRLVEAGEEAGR